MGFGSSIAQLLWKPVHGFRLVPGQQTEGKDPLGPWKEPAFEAGEEAPHASGASGATAAPLSSAGMT